MNQDDGPLEKNSTPPGLAAHEDARALVRLIQCPCCSRPFRNPVTLPCGNSLCRECLPEGHEREGISYPNLPGRRRGLDCPFPNCGQEHPASDCSIDVILTKVMESIAEVVTKQASLANGTVTVIEEVTRWDEVMESASAEKPMKHEFFGGRLVATYTLAAQGNLPYANELVYQDDGDADERDRTLDVALLQSLLEGTHRELDCQVCYNLMLDPVTTFCGHTLCRKCMARVLDHSLHCPVCRRELALPPSLVQQPNNKTLNELLTALCPDTIAARAEAVAAEEQGADGDLTVPLFICTLAFPSQPTYLRIFEPRYRLMLRRCLEGNRQFGMLMYNRYREPQGDLGQVHFYHYGTMLYIENSQLLPDGTSLVETRGVFRFRVKSCGVLDGYTIGSVERLEDVSLAEEEQIEVEETSRPPAGDNDMLGQIGRMSTQNLHSLGHEFIVRMQARSNNWLQQRTLDAYGQPPDDAALFPYWFASIIPVNEEERYKLLAMRTVRERLKITATWIRRIESQRWPEHITDAIGQVPE